MSRLKPSALLAACLLLATPAQAQDALWASFLAPPADTRPLVRWWWFGPSVETGELEREIDAMRVGGFGGFEVQPVYPMAVDGPGAAPRNDPYLSDAFLDKLRHAAIAGRDRSLRVELTLGSGWPFGGPHIGLEHASSSIRVQRVLLATGTTRYVPPPLGQGETLLGATLVPKDANHMDRRPVPLSPAADGITLPPDDGQERDLLLFIAGHTGQQVKRAAVGAEGFVLDHSGAKAVTTHLTHVGDRLMQAFAGLPPPDAIFSDSLEAYGASWTADLPEEFRRRRGYDLLSHLPARFLDTPDSAAVRFDWARTLSELVDERYLAPIDTWARQRGTRFRAQVYGFPPPTLSSNALVAVPEGEGADWRGFTSTRWASSGAHLHGKPITSSEVWTWLRSPSWAATPLDMKVEADRHFLQGVNQLVGHGWPYSPPDAPEPGWAFYAAAALNDHNPWYTAMADVTRYLSRVAHMMRQGQPANGVAIYLPTEDVFAAMRPHQASVNETMHKRVPEALVAQVLEAGHGFDFVDAAAVTAHPLPHRLLILPGLERIDAGALASIADWVKAGGKLVVLGDLPQTAGGLRDDADAERVRRLAKRLRNHRNAVLVKDIPALGAAIAGAAAPDLRLASPQPALGFVRRRMEDGDVYFIANTGNTPISATARFAGDRSNGRWWDPMGGKQWQAGSGDIVVDLAPYESRLLVFHGPAFQATAAGSPVEQARDLTGWTITLPDGRTQPLQGFHSWTESPDLRHVSGTAHYRVRFSVEAGGGCRLLDFGQSLPRDEPFATEARPLAALDTPMREAAIVTVNGLRAGSLWAPPYRLDITPFLRTGENEVEVAVPNSALNILSGRPPADHQLLNARYGERFKPQNMERAAPVPSGLLQPVRLVETAPNGACR